jgi:transposase-like protein
MRTKNTQDNLIAMKRNILDMCLNKTITSKMGAKFLKMHYKSFLRLKSRYNKFGEGILIPKKPGPKKFTPKNKTNDNITNIVCKLAKDRPDLGPVPLKDELKEQYNININQVTIWRILKRNKVRYSTEYKRFKQDPKMYCLDIPGEELQLDACYPYGRSRKITCFDAIDDCSRIVFARLYDRETVDNAISFVSDLVKHSPFKIQRIRADNRYNSKKFIDYCNTLNIEVIINEAYHPERNGKIERFHRTIKQGFFWKYCSYTDSSEYIQLKLNSWLNYYNQKRRHYGFGMDGLTPSQKLTSSLFYSLNLPNTYPQKVTSILQQYIIFI